VKSEEGKLGRKMEESGRQLAVVADQLSSYHVKQQQRAKTKEVPAETKSLPGPHKSEHQSTGGEWLKSI
jgi:hypothetical protein